MLLLGAMLNSVCNIEYSIFLLHIGTTKYNGEVFRRVGLRWVIIHIGNLVGTSTTALLLVFVEIFDQEDEQRLREVLQQKLKVKATKNGFIICSECG